MRYSNRYFDSQFAFELDLFVIDNEDLYLLLNYQCSKNNFFKEKLKQNEDFHKKISKSKFKLWYKKYRI